MKRTQSPDPKVGQWQYEAFKEMFGKDWHEYDDVLFDGQKKVTMFDYEEFFPAGFLKAVDTESEEFRQNVLKLNYESKTDLEQHTANQDLFR